MGCGRGVEYVLVSGETNMGVEVASWNGRVSTDMYMIHRSRRGEVGGKEYMHWDMLSLYSGFVRMREGLTRVHICRMNSRCEDSSSGLKIMIEVVMHLCFANNRSGFTVKKESERTA